MSGLVWEPYRHEFQVKPGASCGFPVSRTHPSIPTVWCHKIGGLKSKSNSQPDGAKPCVPARTRQTYLCACRLHPTRLALTTPSAFQCLLLINEINEPPSGWNFDSISTSCPPFQPGQRDVIPLEVYINTTYCCDRALSNRLKCHSQS